MGIFDSIKSIGKKIGGGIKKLYDIAALNIKINDLNSYKNRLSLMLCESKHIQIPSQHVNLIAKLKEYDFEYGDNVKFKTTINDFAELRKKVASHNEDVEFVLENARDFSSLYDSVIDNPEGFDSSKLCAFASAINRASSFSSLTTEVSNFVSNYEDLKNNYNIILAQYQTFPKAKALLVFEDDRYIDAFEESSRQKELTSLLSVSKGNLYYDFPTAKDIKKAVLKHNEHFVESHLSDKIFDDINGIPLDEDQRRAILCDEATNLVVAGAGSGKTLTICGKVKYLIDVIGIAPEDILLLSYSKASAEDLNSKAKNISREVEAKTFHSMGLNILKKANGCTFVIEDQFERIVEDFFENELVNHPELLSKVISYYGLYSASIDETKKFKAVGELFEAARNNNYKTLKERLIDISASSDKKVTLQREHVKSYEELVIANYYYLNGIEYRYEQPYEHKTDTADKRQYQPDFYLPEYKIYHEHFGINKKGEANQFEGEEAEKYVAGIAWKRDLHEQYQTKCLETYSYQFSDGSIFSSIDKLLAENGIVKKPVSPDKIWDKLKGIIKKTDFSSFKKLIITFINLYKSRYPDEQMFEELKKSGFDNEYDRQRASNLLDICKEVYLYYRAQLAYTTYEDEEEKQKIDFDDMILKSMEALSKLSDFKYRYIIVDEFQDISYSRMLFLKNLLTHGNAKLFAVGDDWQSIYRFSGCDVDIFINAEKYFGKTSTNYITSTHRNSSELISIAAPFITANDEQLKKDVKSTKHTENPIQIMCYKTEKMGAFLETLKLIYQKDDKANVLVLGRNNSDLDSVLPSRGVSKDHEGNLMFAEMESLKVIYKTVHASKGLEADYVILINADDDKLGFPNKMEDDKLLRLVLSNQSEYPYAEERRLFYVALTRTKNICYILVNVDKPSEFVKEIKGKCKFLRYSDAKTEGNIISCPACKTGKLILKTGKDKTSQFWGCMNFPYCEYKNGDIKAVEGGKRCPTCGNFMTIRESKRDGNKFWGCTSYPRCTHTEQIISNEVTVYRPRQ